MDALVPLLVLAVAVWSRLSRSRRAALGGAADALVARLRGLAAAGASAGRPTRAPSAPPRPVAVGTPPAPSRLPPPATTVRAPAPVRPRRPAPAEVAPVTEAGPVVTAGADATSGSAAPSRVVVRRRRLAVGRDLVAAELLAPPVGLRAGGAAWR